MGVNNFDNIETLSRGCKQDRGKTASTRILTRIIIALKEINPVMNHTEISQIIGSSNGVKDALNWLVANKIICRGSNSFVSKSGRNCGSYYLNHKWVKMRNGKTTH